MERIIRYLIITCLCIGLILSMFLYHRKYGDNTSYQVIEKEEHTRLQYTIGNNNLSPNFNKRYYITLRNYDTGIEVKQQVTEEEYENFYVLGDTVNTIVKGGK